MNEKEVVGTVADKNPCTCDACQGGTVHHYYCSVCGSGPWAFRSRLPYTSRQVDTGSADPLTRYIMRHFCREGCYLGDRIGPIGPDKTVKPKDEPLAWPIS